MLHASNSREQREPTLYDLIWRCAGQQPAIENCIPWLRANSLTLQVGTFLADRELEMDKTRLAVPCHPTQPRSKRELADLKKRNPYPSADAADLWRQSKTLEEIALHLDPARLPLDALAFYRPFHCEPSEEWGIYIFLDKLLAYHNRLYGNLARGSRYFNHEAVMGAVLFEMFHHEFFHHVVESAATTLEIISAAFGPPRPVHRLYKRGEYQKQPGAGPHPDDPLEEALANAYAFNSFSFMRFVSHGYVEGLVRFYQRLLPRQWTTEGPGYNSAHRYIHGDYISGAAQLIGMMLASCPHDAATGSELPDANTLLLLGRNVLLNGHVAFQKKAAIPTYLVGDERMIGEFYDLVPAPTETYTSLYWHKDTNDIDAYFQQQYRSERESRTQT